MLTVDSKHVGILVRGVFFKKKKSVKKNGFSVPVSPQVDMQVGSWELKNTGLFHFIRQQRKRRVKLILNFVPHQQAFPFIKVCQENKISLSLSVTYYFENKGFVVKDICAIWWPFLKYQTLLCIRLTDGDRFTVALKLSYDSLLVSPWFTLIGSTFLLCKDISYILISSKFYN